MKRIVLTAAVAAMATLTGCNLFGGKSDPGLIGRLPAGYDAYMTVDPETADLARILEIVEDNLPEYQIADIEDADIGIDVFDWQDWQENLGIEAGEIGIVGAGEDMEFLAIFLPGDGEKLREFVEENDKEDKTAFLEMEGYTVMVIAWEDDDQIDDLEEALEEGPLSEDPVFRALSDKAMVDDPSLGFLFFEEITEFPVMGSVSCRDDETEIGFAMIMEDEELAAYSGLFGNGLQSSSIMFPENTMAAIRTSMDMEKLAEEYEDIARESGADVEDVEMGLAFIGFDSMDEFIAAFGGDYCIAVSEIELDSSGEPEGGSGLIAMSLNDGDKMESSLNMISTLSESERESFGDLTAYLIEFEGNELWYFIHDEVLYVTFNVDPDDVTDGMKASDFFTGDSKNGFMGGAADPDMILENMSFDDDTEEVIETVFSGEDVAFSFSLDGDVGYSRVTVGPGAIVAAVSLAMQMQ